MSDELDYQDAMDAEEQLTETVERSHTERIDGINKALKTIDELLDDDDLKQLFVDKD